ncbi:MAG: Holliday junction resolvase RuvX [Patescibacteria group bacterium]
MRYLGIDYGSKRIGVAVSDAEGKIAFPEAVIPNDRNAIETIHNLILGREVGGVVIGQSDNFSGEPNKIQSDIDKFAKQLESKEMDFEVFFEPEFLTSKQAEQIQGKRESIDASAAAIILQSYLNRAKS